MPETKDAHATLKQKAWAETQKLLIYTAYLSLVFGAFTTYRRLVLAEYQIDYFNYGYGILEALVLAKVILIGEALHFGERYSDRPLIIPTLYKSVVFGILFAVFFVLEHLITGAFHHLSLAEIWADVISKGRNEMVGRAIMMVVAFIPFFAFRELERSIGDVDFIRLFFRGKPASLAPGRGPS